MPRTLRTRCPSCQREHYHRDDERTAVCTACGAEMVMADARGMVLVDIECPACGDVNEVEDDAFLVFCTHCRHTFVPDGPPMPQLLVRDRVSWLEALGIAQSLEAGLVEEGALYLVPSWMYRAGEMSFAIGNEKADPGRSSSRKDKRAVAGAGSLLNPKPGELEYVKKDGGRAVRELLMDPISEPFGWKPFARHVDGATLAPLTAAERPPQARLLAPTWGVEQAFEEGRKRASLRSLTDERTFYKYFEHRALLRESLSLVYHPYWVVYFEPPDVPGRETIPRDWAAIEAVEGEVTRRPAAGGPSLVRATTEVAPLEVRELVEVGCVNCSGRLPPPEPGVVVVACTRCRSLWSVDGGGVRPIRARYAEPAEGQRSDPMSLVYVPFWRFRVHIDAERTDLSNRARWRQWNRVVEVRTDPTDARKPVHFYLMAYGSPRKPRLDALSLGLTRTQPDLTFGSPTIRRTLPAMVRAADAEGLAFSMYLALFKDLTLKPIDALKRTTVQADPPELVFLPCSSRRGEIRDLVVGVTVQLGLGG